MLFSTKMRIDVDHGNDDEGSWLLSLAMRQSFIIFRDEIASSDCEINVTSDNDTACFLSPTIAPCHFETSSTSPSIWYPPFPINPLKLHTPPPIQCYTDKTRKTRKHIHDPQHPNLHPHPLDPCITIPNLH